VRDDRLGLELDHRVVRQLREERVGRRRVAGGRLRHVVVLDHEDVNALGASDGDGGLHAGQESLQVDEARLVGRVGRGHSHILSWCVAGCYN